MKLEGMSIKQLREIRSKIDTVMPQAVNRARADILARMEAEAMKSGLTVREVLGNVGKVPRRSSLPVKYTNPKNPEQTWSGRGRPPLWLTPDMRK